MNEMKKKISSVKMSKLRVFLINFIKKNAAFKFFLRLISHTLSTQNESAEKDEKDNF